MYIHRRSTVQPQATFTRFITYSGVCCVSVCTVSQLTCVLMRTSRRTLEKTSAMLGSSSTPLRGFMLRLRKSRWGMLETMVQIWQPTSINSTDKRKRNLSNNNNNRISVSRVALLFRNITERTTHLCPVLKLIVGQVQLYHVGTESCNVWPVAGFSDSTVIQDQCAGQEQAILQTNKVS